MEEDFRREKAVSAVYDRMGGVKPHVGYFSNHSGVQTRRRQRGYLPRVGELPLPGEFRGRRLPLHLPARRFLFRSALRKRGR